MIGVEEANEESPNAYLESMKKVGITEMNNA